MNNAEFKDQVDAVISFGDEQPIKKLLIKAKERKDEESIVRLQKKLLEYPELKCD